MNPIQAPQNICAEVDRCYASAIPAFVDVVAQFLDHARDLMGTNGLVLTASDFNIGGSEISSVRADSF
jgi:hypothetical protein